MKKFLYFLTAASIALTACQSDTSDEPCVEPASRTEIPDEPGGDNEADDDVVYNERGDEMLTKEQLARRGYSWVEFTKDNFEMGIVDPDDNVVEIPAEGGTTTVRLLSAAIFRHLAHASTREGIDDMYQRCEMGWDFLPAVMDHVYQRTGIYSGPWCLDPYVMVANPYSVTDFYGLSFSHEDPQEITISMGANTTKEDRWIEIDFDRMMWHPDVLPFGLLGLHEHVYFVARGLLYVHQPHKPGNGVVDARI